VFGYSGHGRGHGVERIGVRAFRYREVDSTNERALAALAEGTARHGDVHLALAQTAGRGSRGREWESARGAGLYMSLVLRPGAVLAPSALSIAAGLAVRDALATLGLREVRLKWPNDVVHADAKVAGILIETRGLDPRAPHYVVGIGVNVSQDRFSDELARTRAVTSMRLCGSRASVQDCERTLLAHLARRLGQVEGDTARLGRDYLRALALAGARVRVHDQAGEWVGELLDLDLERGFAVRTPEGELRRVALEGLRQLLRA
jgi:BirA family biotin operon repressor/biotin-[acetyl-CoA-carboxylase] ligase